MIKVELLKKASTPDLKDVNTLIPQLTLSPQSPPLLSPKTFRQLLDQSHSSCVVVRARIGLRRGIIALGTIHFSRLPSGLVAETGDLVVDKDYRNLGLGRAVLEKLIEVAEKRGARHVSLRVNPKRKEAIKMYLALGFAKHPAAFYRINFPRK
mgnify:CR=1 FL=1